MNLFVREMRTYRKSLILLSIGVIVMIISGMSKYKGISASGQSINKLMAGMPKPLQAIFGIGSLDLSKAIGFYGILFLYLLIMGTIHSVLLGATIIAKEENEKTAEFLFAKPISKRKAVFLKLSAAFVNILVLNLVTLAVSLGIVNVFNRSYEADQAILYLIIGLFLLQFLYLFLGAAIAAATKIPKKAAAISMGILLVTYILSVTIDLNSHLGFLKYFTPFKYFEAENILAHNALNSRFVILTCGLIVIFAAITFFSYPRRDLNV